jgi:hypothetical protein
MPCGFVRHLRERFLYQFDAFIARAFLMHQYAEEMQRCGVVGRPREYLTVMRFGSIELARRVRVERFLQQSGYRNHSFITPVV